MDKIAVGPETIYSDVVSRPPGGIKVATNRRIFLRNHVEGLTFENSIIRFDPNVELVNDVFINCVFIFPPVQIPSQPLQKIAATLLASSDLTKVILNPS